MDEDVYMIYGVRRRLLCIVELTLKLDFDFSVYLDCESDKIVLYLALSLRCDTWVYRVRCY